MRRGVYTDEDTEAREDLEAVLAASPMLQIPAAHDPDGLRVLIRHADSHPRARVFAVKSAVRLGLTDLLPDWPETGTTVVHVGGQAARVTASGALVAAATGQPLGYTSQLPAWAPQRSSDAPEVARLLPRVVDLPSLRRAVTVADAQPQYRGFVAKLCAQADRLRWLPDWPELDQVVVSIDGVDHRIRDGKLEPVRPVRPARGLQTSAKTPQPQPPLYPEAPVAPVNPHVITRNGGFLP